jgi:enoyl-CoA hydratase/carnithine racemase
MNAEEAKAYGIVDEILTKHKVPEEEEEEEKGKKREEDEED